MQIGVYSMETPYNVGCILACPSQPGLTHYETVSSRCRYVTLAALLMSSVVPVSHGATRDFNVTGELPVVRNAVLHQLRCLDERADILTDVL